MNSLSEIAESIMQLTTTIREAFAGGFHTFEWKGRNCYIESMSGYLVINGYEMRLSLDKEHLSDLMMYFPMLEEAAKQADKYLEGEREAYKKAREVLSPFILQDKITK